jgi:hypothetical protein
MSRVGPIARAGQYAGSIGIAGLTNGQWNNLTSDDFQSLTLAVTTVLPAGLRLVSATVIVDAATADCFLRFYGSAATPGAADATTDFPKIAAGAALTLEIAGLQQNSGGGAVTGLSLYKTLGATGRIIGFFDAVGAGEVT